MFAIPFIRSNTNEISLSSGQVFPKLKNKTERGWFSETFSLRLGKDETFVVSEITNNMLQMNADKLHDYCVHHGKLLTSYGCFDVSSVMN